MYVTVDVEVDASEVLRKATLRDLVEEVDRRRKEVPLEPPDRLLEKVYQEFRDRHDAPPALREYIYVVMGRIL